MMLLSEPRWYGYGSRAEDADFATFGDTLTELNAYRPTVAIGRTLVSIAQDPGAYLEVMAAAYRQQVLVDNTYAREEAITRAIDRRIADVERATGVTLDNYMRGASLGDISTMAGFELPVEQLDDRPAESARDFFHRRLQELAESFPDQAHLIRPDISIEDDARALARGSAEALEAALGREQVTGLGGVAATLVGSIGGSFRDPLQVATLFIGGGAGTAGSVALRIGQVALREAAINTGVVALMQPRVQAWREEAGLRAGVVPALENLGLAALFGAIPGGAIQGVRELKGPAKRAVEKLAGGTATPAETKRATDALNVPLSDHDAAALRGAAAEPDAPPPLKDVPADLDVEITNQAVRHAEAPDLFPPPEIALAVPPRPQSQTRVIDEALPGESAKVDGKPVAFTSFDPRAIGTDASAFQFKGGTDAAGVSERLRGVSEWDPLASGKVFVFERRAGKRVIADGHQRLALAQRLIGEGGADDITLHGYLYREADGWTPADVRALAAKKNMQEGSGDALDVARILRERPDILDGALPVTGPMMRSAVALARLSDEAFGMVVNGVVPPGHAAAVGAMVPDPAQHAAVLADLVRLKPETEREAKLAIGEIMAAGFRAEEQVDLFGAAETTRSLLAERIKVLDAAMAALIRDKKLFGTLAEKADAIEDAGNVLVRDANAARAMDAAALQDLLSRLARRTGPVSDALNRAASALANGGKPREAAEGFLDEVRALLDRDGLAGLLGEPKLKPAQTVEPASAEAAAAAERANAERYGLLSDEAPALERAEAVLSALKPAEPDMQQTPLTQWRALVEAGAAPDELAAARTALRQAAGFKRIAGRLADLVRLVEKDIPALRAAADEAALADAEAKITRLADALLAPAEERGAKAAPAAETRQTEPAATELPAPADAAPESPGGPGGLPGEQAPGADLFGPVERLADPAAQLAIPGIEPAGPRPRPDRRANLPPPRGGLFDEQARAQQDLLDTLGGPVLARKDTPDVRLTSLSEALAEADRPAYHADIIDACKD